MLVAELVDGQTKESVLYDARGNPIPDIPRLLIGYAPGIGVLLQKWSSGSSRSRSMIEKSVTEGTGEIGLSSELGISRSIRSGWNGRSVVVRKGEPRTLDNKREKRGESSEPGFTASGMGRDRLGGGDGGLEGRWKPCLPICRTGVKEEERWWWLGSKTDGRDGPSWPVRALRDAGRARCDDAR